MATVALPSYVKVVNDYSVNDNFGVVRLEMYNGVSKQRRTLSTPLKQKNMTFFIHGNDRKKAFDTWFNTDINGGTDRFIFLDNITNTKLLVSFVNHPLQWQYSGGPANVWMSQVTVEYRGM